MRPVTRDPIYKGQKVKGQGHQAN